MSMGKRRTWTIGAAILLGLGVATSWAAGSLMVHDRPSHVAPPIWPATDFRIRVPDGTSVAATYWPGRKPASPAVLLLHSNHASRDVVRDNAGWLARRGFAVLTIDFRGHGQSDDADHSFGWFESRDARAAFLWLKREQRAARVAVVGISLGGAASLIGENGPLPADALVLQAVYPDFRRAIRNRIATITTVGPAYLLEPLLTFQSRPRFGIWPDRLTPLAKLPEVRSPVMIIGGGEDRYTPPAETREMFAAVKGPRTLWLVPGADHAAASALRTTEYRQRLLAFLVSAVGHP